MSAKAVQASGIAAHSIALPRYGVEPALVWTCALS
jgi:hypothetical protein